MELASSLNIKLPFPIKKKFVNVFGSVEVENAIVTSAKRKYWDKLYEPIIIFLYILRAIFINFIRFEDIF